MPRIRRSAGWIRTSGAGGVLLDSHGHIACARGKRFCLGQTEGSQRRRPGTGMGILKGCEDAASRHAKCQHAGGKRKGVRVEQSTHWSSAAPRQAPPVVRQKRTLLAMQRSAEKRKWGVRASMLAPVFYHNDSGRQVPSERVKRVDGSAIWRLRACRRRAMDRNLAENRRLGVTDNPIARRHAAS